jgi:hypothetical protein
MDRKSFLQTLGLGAVAAMLPAVAKAAEPARDNGWLYEMARDPGPTPEQLAELSGLPHRLPMSEILALREHLEEAVSDPSCTIVVNYPMEWVLAVAEYYGIKLEGSGAVVIAAEDIPAVEVQALRAHVRSMREKHGGFELACLPGVSQADLRAVWREMARSETGRRHIVLNYNAEWVQF